MGKLKIIPDANAIIDLHRLSLWKPVVHACQIAVTPIICREAAFYKDNHGQKKAIDLSQDIASRTIEELLVPLEIFRSLQTVLKDCFLDGIDAGEREAIAFLHTHRNKGYHLFCTADLLAIKCLGVLGMRYQSISLEELLEKTHLKANCPSRYSKRTFEKMLGEGSQEAHLYRKTDVEAIQPEVASHRLS